MKILTANFIKKFKGKIINIHPSLLPKYKGLNTHQRTLDNKEKYSGVHSPLC
jgi:phosphoribosylglycinamide formyltransferase-1